MSSPPDFKGELVATARHLRAFARGLCGRADMADDLVQETLLRAWSARERFTAGTSMRAWTFTILRNIWLTEMRRNRFRGDYDQTQAERTLITPAGQEGPLHLADLSRALLAMPAERREALLLVGAGGFSYEEAAEICGCALGTIKSRVARGRAQLASMIEEGKIGSRAGGTDASATLLAELDRISPNKPD
ncbi:sigma-70 family RNA polymerase sigma factor [Novosphingobium umbonatum]|uniref:Sigma-70 family RNA polymerase sigma factor n=1 Tax=Novosphingobium umbonatum TaxID=1908524 RepID=A0A3S2X2K4_9SPHN|nr:sigma-70 family RNA polymerase sigma factor [Novosphingobium umbonatum]RVU04100.1 sigma-70 family RNA polymerase sigma factor [Novosphingobium umbonatum]